MPFPHINIRQKIISAFLFLGICLCVLGAFSYRQLALLEEKSHSIEKIDDILNAILEFRRQEKNYLLYGTVESYSLALQGISHTATQLTENEVFAGDKKLQNLMHELAGAVGQYRETMVRMYELSQVKTDQLPEEVERLRKLGQHIVDIAGKASEEERTYFLRINSNLQNQLLASVIAVFVLLLGFFYMLSTRVLKPLKIIELTTQEIAQGNFKPLAVRKTNDEVRHVQIAFNRMVEELKKRQDQLVHAQKMSSIGTLSSGIAHQVNNPLNNISTSAQILRDELNSAPPFSAKLINNIEQETARARDIVRGLLEFARHAELAMRVAPLHEVVGTAVRLISSQIPAGITLTDDIPENIFVRLDPQRMNEVLLNLFINALQAIPSQVGTIDVYVEPSPQNTSQTTLVVEDSGEGIDEEDLTCIFDPFFTRKEVGQGTGLGLSVAYGIIEEFEGVIRVESVKGKGTRFLIDLPLVDEASADCFTLPYPALNPNDNSV